MDNKKLEWLRPLVVSAWNIGEREYATLRAWAQLLEIITGGGGGAVGSTMV